MNVGCFLEFVGLGLSQVSAGGTDCDECRDTIIEGVLKTWICLQVYGGPQA